MIADQVANTPTRVKPRQERSVWRWVWAIIILVVFGLIVRLFATNANMRWDVVGSYLFNPQVLTGVRVTVELTVLGQAVAIALGFVLALMRQSRNPVSSAFAQVYIWLFRAAPLIVQLLFWYNIAILVPRLAYQIPFTHTGFQVSMNTVISGFTAAILGLGLHEAAYMAEIIRSGTLAVPKGQVDAALSIGLPRGQAMRRIVLPQTLRVIIPPTGNQFIGLLKASALVSVIGGGDLLTRVQQIYGQNFLVIPMLIVATIWYIVLVSIFSICQHFIEVRQSGERQYGDAFWSAATYESAALHAENKVTLDPVGNDPGSGPSFDEQQVVLSVEGVHKWLGQNHVLRGVDLEVHRGEIVVVIGPSGSGKSTLLRCINHLEAIDAGQIRLEGELIGYFNRNDVLYEKSDADVAEIRRNIGVVFQQFNLFSHMTALENVAYGPRRVLKLSRAEAEERANTLLARVGLASVAQSHPSRLSGGQQQRVAIARALAMEPKLMLFDEPTSSLDPELVHEVLSVMTDVAQLGMTMVVVTHEIDFARNVGNQLVMIDEGVIVESGPCAEMIQHPKHSRTEQFLRRVQRDG